MTARRPQCSIHGSCTVDDYGQCDECGEYWPDMDSRTRPVVPEEPQPEAK